MSTFGERFKEARVKAGLTQDKVRQKLRKSINYIPQLEADVIHQPRGDFIAKAAKLFNVSPVWLRLGEGHPYTIPIIDWSEVLKWPSLKLDKKETIAMTIPGYESTYALSIKDDLMSMPGAPISFEPNDIAIIDPAKSPESGKFVLAVGEGYTEPVLKKYVVDGPRRLLLSLKQGIPPITLDDKFEILGVVVRKMSSQAC